MKETGPTANGEKMSIEGDHYLGPLEAFMRGHLLDGFKISYFT